MHDMSVCSDSVSVCLPGRQHEHCKQLRLANRASFLFWRVQVQDAIEHNKKLFKHRVDQENKTILKKVRRACSTSMMAYVAE